MIKVNVFYNDDAIKSIEVSGHATDAPEGESIVCAGVSMLVLGNLAYAEHMRLGEMTVIQRQDGYIQVVIEEQADGLDILLEAIIFSLRQLTSDYPKHIKIIENKK